MTSAHPISLPTARRWSSHAISIVLFVAAMSAAVIGLVAWKVSGARHSALTRSQTDTANLAHSLVEHINHTVKSADIAMNGLVDLLRYQDPLPERMNAHLGRIVQALPQLRQLDVMSADGTVRYSSSPAAAAQGATEGATEGAAQSATGRDYFAYHRDNADPLVRINDPSLSAPSSVPIIALSRRITKVDGTFAGILVAEIDIKYLNSFYDSLDLGAKSGVSLLRTDGMTMTHWPSGQFGKNLGKTIFFTDWLKASRTGFHKVPSAFDGVVKYFAYEQSSEYPLVLTVAQSEGAVLGPWRQSLKSDVWVAVVVLLVIMVLAAVLFAQFEHRVKMEKEGLERESRYRLLADNIADIIIRLDRHGCILFVSPSVRNVLDIAPDDLIGKSCFDMTHPDDVESVKTATARLTPSIPSISVTFRTFRSDRHIVWVEIIYKLVPSPTEPKQYEFVGVLRDVTERRHMENQLTSLNRQLAQLASHDPMTGLANRRALDSFLQKEFQAGTALSVLMIDIDNFKGFNDSLGHIAGDGCLKEVARVIEHAASGTRGLCARYGGEEFAIILPDMETADAFAMAETIRLRIAGLAIVNAAAAHGVVSVSIGVSSRTDATRNEHDLMNEADMALYEAKRQGRNRTVIARHLIAAAEHIAADEVTLQPGLPSDSLSPANTAKPLHG